MTHSPLLQYDSNYPLYGISFSNSPQHPLRLALSTLVTGPSNKLMIVDHIAADQNGNNSYYAPPANGSDSSSSNDFRQIASINLNLPATKVGWEPRESLVANGGGYDDAGGRGELLATSGDALRIWEVNRDWANDASTKGGGGGYVGKTGRSDGGPAYALRSRSVLSNSKIPHSSMPPVTSFSWNTKSPNSIVACSIDTTATLWDIQTSQAVTQLIAHDRAVYDLSWLPDSSDIFVSVGADGSLRAFDLRQLEHSTILYESSKESPLARIAFSRKEQHMLACFGIDDSKVMILDMRSPGSPVAELIGHQAPVGAVAWGSPGLSSSSSSGGGGWVATCGDDSQLLLYDLTEPITPTTGSGSGIGTKNRSSPYKLKSTSTSTSTSTSNTPFEDSLSPPLTPSIQPSPTPSEAIEILPSRAWSATSASTTGAGGGGGTEINNLAFSEKGDWVGCVSGSRLNVLRV